jgi:hypothetical protein
LAEEGLMAKDGLMAQEGLMTDHFEHPEKSCSSCLSMPDHFCY